MCTYFCIFDTKIYAGFYTRFYVPFLFLGFACLYILYVGSLSSSPTVLSYIHATTCNYMQLHATIVIQQLNT